MGRAKPIPYETPQARLSPVEDMRIANLLERHRAIVERARRNVGGAQIALKDAESVLAALLEKYPNHDGSRS